jgi:germination protein M
VTVAGNVATVDLSKSFASGGGTLSMTVRLAQVVFTATQFPTVEAVTFKLDGKPVKVLGGEGIIIDKPQTRAMFEAASPAILIESPAWGATVSQGSVIRGTADVFEAVFRLQVRDSTGKVVLDRTVQATSGTDTRGTWKATAPLVEAKAGAGTLRVFAESAKDGHPIDVVTVPVVLRP